MTAALAPDVLVALADEWSVDYWRLWVELSRFTNHREALAGRRGYHHRVRLPAAPLLTAAARHQLHAGDATLRAALCRARRCGYVTVPVAERLCRDLALDHPALVWGARWHALSALDSQGLVRL